MDEDAEARALRIELATLKLELRRREAAMELALRALVMSSPHTDALYRWKDDAWRAQRAEAIQALQPPAQFPR